MVSVVANGPTRRTQECLTRVTEPGGKFFQGCIVARNFTRLSTAACPSESIRQFLQVVSNQEMPRFPTSQQSIRLATHDESCRHFRGKQMLTILSYGMGVESTAILVRWIKEPSIRPCPLEELILITSQTGDEYNDTQRDVETHILPLLREHRIRYVQLARRGHLEADGITILSDSREPERLFIKGDYKLSDELRLAGTVPQYGGEHTCSLKFKAWVIEQWLTLHLNHPARHAFGYNADETARVARSEAAALKRIAFGFNVEERGRIEKALSYDTALRQSFYPLVEWGWTRQDCIDYLRSQLGITWRKSACVQCPFNALKDDALARNREHPKQVAEAMMLEHLSLSLNPRGTLYRNQSLIEITDANGNTIATSSYRRQLDQAEWAIYRVRRIYQARKDKNGGVDPNKKGIAYRAVEQQISELRRATALEALRELATNDDTIVEQRGITYVYRLRCAATYPTREEFLVALPAVVATKARHGLDWFEEKWSSSQGCLFTL